MRRLEIDLQEMNDRLLAMGSLVASSVHRSTQALIEKSEVLAHQVIRDEARIDQMEIQIDDLATSMIALSQPVARDMRFITVAIKINTDLERMGDLALGIVERALSLMHQPALPEFARLPELAQLVQFMVLQSLDSFVKRDPDLASQLIASDDSVDRTRNDITQGLIASMQADPTSIPNGVTLLIIVRNLERIADHATNIAEDVIFMVKGEDVRHSMSEESVEA